MNGPTEELRIEIRAQVDEIVNAAPPRTVTPEAEDRLTTIVGRITDALQADLDREDDDPQDLLDATNEWAGLLSYAVSRVYAPASPWPLGLGGWGRGPVKSMRRAAGLLQKPLARAATALGANGFSISVGFPWGVAVGLSWPLTPHTETTVADTNTGTTRAAHAPGMSATRWRILWLRDLARKRWPTGLKIRSGPGQ